jgi:hypothetical protein
MPLDPEVAARLKRQNCQPPRASLAMKAKKSDRIARNRDIPLAG